MKQKLIVALISSAFLLTACGGGDGDSSGDSGSNTPNNGNGNGGQTTPPKPDLGTSTGSVVEPLDLSHKYSVLYDFFSNSGVSNNTELKQNQQGIVTEFGSYQIKGELIAKEINGNKNYALARLAKGIVEKTDNQTGKITTTELSKYSNDSYYYFAFTPLDIKVVADNKVIQCTELNSTQARLNNAKNKNSFITPTVRNASMTLQTDGQFNIQFTVNAENNETTFVGKMPWVESFNAYNGFNMLGIQNQAGANNQIGTFAVSKNGANSFVVGAIYKTTLADQSQYQGLASMTCNF